MITWLGHAGFKVQVTDPTTGEPKVIFFDPWFNSPVCPESEKNPEKADFILVSHGHFDHCSDSPGLSKRTGATVLSVYELGQYMEANQASSTTSMNKGGTLEYSWGSITMVGAEHSGGCLEGGFIGGAPAGYVVTFKDGTPSIYHAGDTNVFTDMKIISDLYAPQIALLPIGGHYTMGPREAAYALNQFLTSVKTVIPMHYGTFPLLKGTPQELKDHLQTTFKPEGREMRVQAMSYGETLTLNSLIN